MPHQLKLDNLKVYNLTKLFDLSVSDKANINYAHINNLYIDGKIEVNEELKSNTITTQTINAEDSLITKCINTNDLYVCNNSRFENITVDGKTLMKGETIFENITVKYLKGSCINIGNCNSIVNIPGILNVNIGKVLVLNNKDCTSINDCGIVVSNNGNTIGYIKGSDNDWTIKSPNMVLPDIIATKSMVDDVNSKFVQIDISLTNLINDICSNSFFTNNIIYTNDLSFNILKERVNVTDTSLNVLTSRVNVSDTLFNSLKQQVVLADVSLNFLTLYTTSLQNTYQTLLNGISGVTDISAQLFLSLIAYQNIIDTSQNLLDISLNTLSNILKERLNVTDASLNILTSRVNVIDSSFNILKSRVNVIDSSFNILTSRANVTDSSLNVLTSRVNVTDTSLNVLTSRVSVIDSSLNILKTRANVIDTSFNVLTARVNVTDVSFNNYLNDFLIPTIIDDAYCGSNSVYTLKNTNIEVVVNTSGSTITITKLTGITFASGAPTTLSSGHTYTYRKIGTKWY
jgi:hypothetical protein